MRTCCPRRQKPSAVTTNAASASFSAWPSPYPEKSGRTRPPSRITAKKATISSGHIGVKSATRSPFRTPSAACRRHTSSRPATARHASSAGSRPSPSHRNATRSATGVPIHLSRQLWTMSFVRRRTSASTADRATCRRLWWARRTRSRDRRGPPARTTQVSGRTGQKIGVVAQSVAADERREGCDRCIRRSGARRPRRRSSRFMINVVLDTRPDAHHRLAVTDNAVLLLQTEDDVASPPWRKVCSPENRRLLFFQAGTDRSLRCCRRSCRPPTPTRRLHNKNPRNRPIRLSRRRRSALTVQTSRGASL